MKKSLVALAALAAVGAASAQSTVTLYGVVDANVTSARQGGSTLTTVGTSGLNGSRFGMRGAEDLGGGLKAIFQIENGFNTDNGGTAQTGTLTGSRLFGRQAWVGVEGGFGSVRIGRMYTPIGLLLDESATMGTKPMDTLARVGMLASSNYRTDNALTYTSPSFGGLVVSGQYATANDGPEVTTDVGRHYGFSALYKAGPIQAGLGYINVRGAADVDATGILANLGYNFGFAAVKAVIERDDLDTTGAEDPTWVGLEASVPLGAFTGSVGFGRASDLAGVNGRDANLWTLQGVYNLSKRTALYTFYTHINNKGSSARGFATASATETSPLAAAASAAGQKARAFQVGVRHSF